MLYSHAYFLLYEIELNAQVVTMLDPSAISLRILTFKDYRFIHYGSIYNITIQPKAFSIRFGSHRKYLTFQTMDFLYNAMF